MAPFRKIKIVLKLKPVGKLSYLHWKIPGYAENFIKADHMLFISCNFTLLSTIANKYKN